MKIEGHIGFVHATEDFDQFSHHVEDSDGMGFPARELTFVDASKERVVESAHSGGLPEGGAQGGTAALGDFGTALPLAAFADARFAAGEGEDALVHIAGRLAGGRITETLHVADFGGDDAREQSAEALDGAQEIGSVRGGHGADFVLKLFDLALGEADMFDERDESDLIAFVDDSHRDAFACGNTEGPGVIGVQAALGGLGNDAGQGFEIGARKEARRREGGENGHGGGGEERVEMGQYLWEGDVQGGMYAALEVALLPDQEATVASESFERVGGDIFRGRRVVPVPEQSGGYGQGVGLVRLASAYVLGDLGRGNQRVDGLDLVAVKDEGMTQRQPVATGGLHPDADVVSFAELPELGEQGGETLCRLREEARRHQDLACGRDGGDSVLHFSDIDTYSDHVELLSQRDGRGVKTGQPYPCSDIRHPQAMTLKRESSYQGSVSRRLNRVFPVFRQGYTPKETTLMDTPEIRIVQHRAAFWQQRNKEKEAKRNKNLHLHSC